MNKSGLTVKCCWCNEMMDTTEAILIEGIFSVHKDKCKDDFIEENTRSQFSDIGFSINE